VAKKYSPLEIFAGAGINSGTGGNGGNGGQGAAGEVAGTIGGVPFSEPGLPANGGAAGNGVNGGTGGNGGNGGTSNTQLAPGYCVTGGNGLAGGNGVGSGVRGMNGAAGSFLSPNVPPTSLGYSGACNS
jgi:hypothetical protein